MPQISREITLAYGGETYRFTPSNRLLRRVDAGLSPSTLLGVVNVMNGQQLPLFDIAYIVSEFIREGGGDVSEDDVLAELYEDMTENKGDGVRGLIAAIGEVITPPDVKEGAGKNRKAPAKTGARKQK